MTSINLSRIIDPKASKVPIGDFIDKAYALPNSPSLKGRMLLMKYPIIIDSNRKRNEIVQFEDKIILHLIERIIIERTNNEIHPKTKRQFALLRAFKSELRFTL